MWERLNFFPVISVLCPSIHILSNLHFVFASSHLYKRVRVSVCPLALRKNHRKTGFQPARRIVLPARACFSFSHFPPSPSAVFSDLKLEAVELLFDGKSGARSFVRPGSSRHGKPKPGGRARRPSHRRYVSISWW